jgi:hypothetical protein
VIAQGACFAQSSQQPCRTSNSYFGFIDTLSALQDNPRNHTILAPYATKIEEAQLKIQEKTTKILQEREINGTPGIFTIKEKPQQCQYHLDYLSERVQKEQNQDDCLTCKKLLNAH